jgi:hypothetical protein
LIPSTLVRLSLTGQTVPPKGLLTRLHRTARPTLPARSVAPITATVSGAKIASSGCGSERQTFVGALDLDDFPALLALLGFAGHIAGKCTPGRDMNL